MLYPTEGHVISPPHRVLEAQGGNTSGAWRVDAFAQRPRIYSTTFIQ